ncbi:carboxymuconolactone decarboxylase family protein [Schlesneria sp. T3-172]|uniref:carboxymuconolactone decarboxylase family protein n=1 Tax=Schlesneria sphaerica TaxID=3373610 RepID=UPI0037C5492B
MLNQTIISLGIFLAAAPETAPRPVPLTRPEMKRLIEDVKVRTPRIPMPELTDADRQALGDRADDYEAVIRHRYTPWVETRRTPRASGPNVEQEPGMTLSYAFKTQLFWIVSRANNCQYCIGHQESKLLNAGLTEDQIAALDGDWSRHTPAEQAAFAFARKLSFQPYAIGDADIQSLRRFYTDLQILEMVISVSGNNVSNRWKEAVAVPQRKDEGGYSRNTEDLSLPRGTYLTPTSASFEKLISNVAPIIFDTATGAPTRDTISRRPALESRTDVERALTQARSRKARLPLVEEHEARTNFAGAAPEGPLPQWVRLLANFPREGTRHLNTIRLADEKSDLSPLLKGQLAWIVARQDGAWYAVGHAYKRLRDAGQTDEQIYALDGDWHEFSPRDQSLFTVARKLAASPVILTDADVTNAVELAGPRDVVQSIHYTTSRSLFDRITEAAGLQLEN